MLNVEQGFGRDKQPCVSAKGGLCTEGSYRCSVWQSLLDNPVSSCICMDDLCTAQICKVWLPHLLTGWEVMGLCSRDVE